jgi:hypothetical protein
MDGPDDRHCVSFGKRSKRKGRDLLNEWAWICEGRNEGEKEHRDTGYAPGKLVDLGLRFHTLTHRVGKRSKHNSLVGEGWMSLRAANGELEDIHNCSLIWRCIHHYIVGIFHFILATSQAFLADTKRGVFSTERVRGGTSFCQQNVRPGQRHSSGAEA